MPMFYTPKPRQFHYKPRFYDPEKEEWEKLKTKYRLEHGLPLDDNALKESTETSQTSDDDKDLAYFQRKVREIDKKDRASSQRLTISDLFRKREKPQFHYVSCFDSEGNIIDTPSQTTREATVKRRITRRFEDDDEDRFKPIPAGKIIVYTLIVFCLLVFIFF